MTLDPAIADVLEGRERWAVARADSLALLKTLPDACVDAVVTDPPAGIAFMDKAWDNDKGGRRQWIAWLAEIMTECRRVMKPGAHGLVWALPRTSHWTGTACEDAGFDPRDMLLHIFGSGFPKSLDVSKAIDAAAGAEREVVRTPMGPTGNKYAAGLGDGRPWMQKAAEVGFHEHASNEPVTDAARQWSGWGTALKPSHECWWLIRAPFKGTVAANVCEHGTGALNIEACRVATDPDDFAKLAAGVEAIRERGGTMQNSWKNCSDLSGANPANVAARFFPCFEWDEDDWFPFRYVPKASRAEREAGCEDLPKRTAGEVTGGRKEGSAALDCPRTGAGRTSGGRNDHPTVKPIALMRWLCRLITPPGGIVLDPFAGSGTTILAANQEGFRSIGIELDEHHCEIAEARIRHHVGGRYHEPVRRAEPEPETLPKRVQLALFGGGK